MKRPLVSWPITTPPLYVGSPNLGAGRECARGWEGKGKSASGGRGVLPGTCHRARASRNRPLALWDSEVVAHAPQAAASARTSITGRVGSR